MPSLHDDLVLATDPDAVTAGAEAGDDYGHDESLRAGTVTPAWVVRPRSAEEVAAVVAVARRHRAPLTPRGSATGLSGGCVPRAGGVVVSFERMRDVIEIDVDNHVAVVQPGVTLAELNEAAGAHGLVYPVAPGEDSASLGGTVATNAGGMRAVRYGVTRHHVVGLEAVLGTGEVVRAGGKFVKSTSGYDIAQVIIGSEGTLALVTEVTVRLYPKPSATATLLAPFASLAEATGAVPGLVMSGVGPVVVEYVDALTMATLTGHVDLDLGVPAEVAGQVAAYLVVVLEGRTADRLDADVADAAELLATSAIDVYVLPPAAGHRLIKAREQLFWVAKANHADDLLDTVVPRASIPAFLAEVATLAEASGSFVVGCGHAGDGNVHLSVFQSDPDRRRAIMEEVIGAALRQGGAVSGEHGIGLDKKDYLARFEDPAKLALWRRIKTAFDPDGILNPGTVFDGDPAPGPPATDPLRPSGQGDVVEEGEEEVREEAVARSPRAVEALR